MLESKAILTTGAYGFGLSPHLQQLLTSGSLYFHSKVDIESGFGSFLNVKEKLGSLEVFQAPDPTSPEVGKLLKYSIVNYILGEDKDPLLAANIQAGQNFANPTFNLTLNLKQAGEKLGIQGIENSWGQFGGSKTGGLYLNFIQDSVLGHLFGGVEATSKTVSVYGGVNAKYNFAESDLTNYLPGIGINFSVAAEATTSHDKKLTSTHVKGSLEYFLTDRISAGIQIGVGTAGSDAATQGATTPIGNEIQLPWFGASVRVHW